MPTPSQLAKSDTEHGHQVALMAFAAIARIHGFEIAWEFDRTNDPTLFKNSPHKVNTNEAFPCLKWFHAIPNGGIRGDTEEARKIRGGQLKAEGVKKGVLDTFLPYPISDKYGNIEYCGLYIEMKKPSQRPKDRSKNPNKGMSDEQIEFTQFCREHNYGVATCYDWVEAAKVLQSYLTYGG